MVDTLGVELLNASYEPLTSITLQRAVKLLYLGKVEIEEACESGRTVGPYLYPRVLRLVRYVRVPYHRGVYRYSRQPSRTGVLIRDSYICAYCGREGADTIDHVVPRSRGGKSEWLNLVAACEPCNTEKRDQTPEEAGMKLCRTPFIPKRPKSLAIESL